MNLIMKIGWKTADTEVPLFETKIEWEEFYALRPPNKVVALMEIRELIERELKDAYFECKEDMSEDQFEGMMRAVDPKALKVMKAADNLLVQAIKKDKGS